MSVSMSFVVHVQDLLCGVGAVRARAMFGGYGLSLDGVSIGILDDDRLFLRCDDETRGQFEAAGSQPFVYPSKQGPMTMKNYWALPDEALDDPERASVWGLLAAEAARRAEAAKKAKKPRNVVKAKPAKKAAKPKAKGGAKAKKPARARRS